MSKPIDVEYTYSDKTIVIAGSVMGYLYSQRQLEPSTHERGGLLFGKEIKPYSIKINHVISIKPKKSSPTFRETDLKEEKKQIKNEEKKGFHLMGFWHTHPEKSPSPSPLDQDNTTKIFTNSDHDMPLLAVIIVGEKNIDDFFIGVVSEKGIMKAKRRR